MTDDLSDKYCAVHLFAGDVPVVRYASGLGMMSRFHYTQISDFFLQPRIARIQNGMWSVPIEYLQCVSGQHE